MKNHAVALGEFILEFVCRHLFFAAAVNDHHLFCTEAFRFGDGIDCGVAGADHRNPFAYLN